LIYKTSDSNIEFKSGGLKSAFSHLLAGSDVFLLKIDGPGNLGFAGFLPGKILKIELNGNGIIAEFNSFLCMDSTVSYSTKFAGVFKGIFGGEGLFLEKFTGSGNIFLHGHGYVIEFDLKSGEEIQVEASHILAFEDSVQYSIKRLGGIKTMILGGFEGEGLFFATINGPGKVWLHTISLQQLAAKLSVKSGNTGNAAVLGGAAGLALGLMKR
ncbi:MAG: AIM24 family protein, partial [Candidatus Parvarchaeum sp.]